MHRFPGNLILCLLTVAVLDGCDFKPKDEYFRDLKPNLDPREVTISVVGHGDTLVFTRNETFRIQLTPANCEPLFYRILVNDTEVDLRELNSGEFTLGPKAWNLPDGAYVLSVEVGVHSGTGSIADETGAEGVLFHKDFLLFVFTDYTTFTPFMDFFPESGSLRIVVNVPSSKPYVKKIEVYKPGSNSASDLIAILTEANGFTGWDGGFVGEWTTYHAKAYTGFPGSNFYLEIGDFQEGPDFDLPPLTASTDSLGYPHLTWRKSNYYSNVGSYRIYSKDFSNEQYHLDETVYGVDDTSVTLSHCTWPGYLQYKLVVVPQNPPSYFDEETALDHYASSTSGQSGAPSFTYWRLLIPVGVHFYYNTTFGVIMQHSIETGQTHEIEIPQGWAYAMAVSPNDKYVLVATGLSDFDYLLYNVESSQSTFHPSSEVIGAGVPTGAVSVADNGIAAICSQNKIFLYDFLQDEVLGTLQLTSQADRAVISPDGTFLFVNDGTLALWEFRDASFHTIWSSASISGPIAHYGFEAGDPGRAYVFSDHTLEVRNRTDWSFIRSLTLESDEICNIDFGSSMILGEEEGFLRIYHYTNGSQIYTNPKDQSNSNFRFRANTIYSSGGSKLVIF